MRSMRLHDLLNLVNVAYQHELVNPIIKGISFNSSDVTKGYLFLGLPGTKVDGGVYCLDAFKNGAEAAIISEEAYLALGKIKNTKVLVLSKPLHNLFGRIISEFWNRPSNKLKIIGITGTNGKTTIAFLLEHILKNLGKDVALFGTLFNRWPGYYESSTHTTDFADKLQPKLNLAYEANVNYVVMEVSSHAIDQKRISGCSFDAAIFTNLTQDHLDYHKNMKSYFKTKMELFNPPFLDSIKGYSVINIDDQWGRKLNQNLSNKSVIISTKDSYKGLANEKKFFVSEKRFTKDGTYCVLHNNLEKIDLFIPLIGEFNLMNAIQSIAVLNQFGFLLKDICNAIKSFPGVPGRMELIKFSGPNLSINYPEVIVDYAHTPDGLKKVLATIKQIALGRIITVFGCGGNRDSTKRSMMGSIAEELSDFIFITSDNPRMEEPEDIIDDILCGINNKEKVKIYLDRFEAIKEAINLAEPKDIVLIAGKGHENYQIIKDKKLSFDDRKVAYELLLQKIN